MSGVSAPVLPKTCNSRKAVYPSFLRPGWPLGFRVVWGQATPSLQAGTRCP